MNNVIEETTKITEIYKNRTKNQIIHLLHIHDELSTSDIARILGKSKTTILRNMETDNHNGLVDLNLIKYREEISSGRYNKRVYSFNREADSDRIHNISSRKEKIIAKNNIKIAEYIRLKGIINDSINYLKRLGDEFSNNTSDIEELKDLRKDNLGTLSFKYLSSLELRNLIKKDQINVNDDQQKDYLQIRMILPIKRLVEMNNTDKWSKDGTLWFYNEKK